MPVPRSARRRQAPLAVALVLLALAGCTAPTPYQPTADGYGYSEQQLESNRYRVTFSGNSVTPRATVQNYLLYRAAEVTLAGGHDYFTMVDQNVERSTTYYGTGGGDFGYGGFNRNRTAFGLGVGNYTAYPIDSYTAFADIIVARGAKPADALNAYDAREVMRLLEPQIGRPDDA
jgi:hypothetical protein